MLHRYSRWDGTQAVPDLDADDLLAAMSDDLLTDGDLQSALRRLLQRGLRQPAGQRLPGLQDLLERLRRRRQERLDRYDLGTALEDIERKLEEVIRTEREGIRRRVAEGRERVERGQAPPAPQEALERLAAEREAALDGLPPDAAGRIRQLQDYQFVDREARRLFEELLRSLQQQMREPFLRGMQQALQGLTPADLRRMREMLQDLNRMLAERADGREPDFEAFRRKWGQHFPGVESLDQLIEMLAGQIGRMQSLLASMSPGQRSQLEEMMRSVLLQDERLDAALAQLGMHLAELAPDLGRRYDFRGEESLTLDEAMRLMDELHGLADLERRLRGARDPGDLERIDPADVEELLGPEARQDLDRLRELARKLEEAGYLERRGDRLDLTARAIRRIGDRALRDIFALLKRDRFGGHPLDSRGAGGDPTDEAKRYEFGDPFLLDLKETLMNAVERGGPGTPVRLQGNDFEVFRTERQTQAATVVMLDMSRSMINNGCFLPAKKVALALASLIRNRFPRDTLYIVGFSLYAREFRAEELPGLSWSEWSIGTNIHAGLLLSRQLLGRHKGGTRQVIMITDGEPTAHLEGAEAEFAYPPTARTLRETLKEVRRCTREGLLINTFMLDQSPMLTAFVEQMARINRGRAFFASPERLGAYVLVDYVRAKRQRIE